MTEVESRCAEGARQRATAMVWALGGSSVTLRTAAVPVAGDEGEQLGLATPLFSDLPVGPAVLRRSAKMTVLLVPGAVLETALGLAGVEAVRESLKSVAIVTVGDESFAVSTVEALQVFGRAYLYRIGCVPSRA